MQRFYRFFIVLRILKIKSGIRYLPIYTFKKASVFYLIQDAEII